MDRAVWITLLISALLLWGLRRVAFCFQWVDQPGGRKDHLLPTPVVGGLAMAIAFFIGVWSTAVSWEEAFLFYFACALLLMAAGFLDDLADTPFRRRLLIQTLAALGLCLKGGAVLTHLGSLLGGARIELGILSVPFTVFAIVGVINAINMLDGLDGLAGGVVFLATAVFALIAHHVHASLEEQLLLILLGALGGFLLWNIRWGQRHARVFMGDAGSLFLGISMAWFAIRLTQFPSARSAITHEVVSPVVALVILAIPVANALVTMLQRMRRGLSPFLPARDHAHDQLLRRGWGVSQTVLFFWLLEALLIAAAYGGGVLYHWSDGLLFSIFWLVFIAFWALNGIGQLEDSK